MKNINLCSSSAIEVLYEDDFLFVLNKPSLLHSVANPRSCMVSLASILLEHAPSLGLVAPKKGDAGLIQRLDFETSGIVLGAKVRRDWVALSQKLKLGEIQKIYHVLVEGRPQKSFSVDSFLGSPYRRSKKVRVYCAAKPPPRTLRASTCFRPLLFFPAHRLSLIEGEASPARRHQVRAHAAHSGYPLVGDSLYGSRLQLRQLANGDNPSIPGFLLHARLLTFTHPRTGERLSLEAPYPKWVQGGKLLGKHAPDS